MRKVFIVMLIIVILFLVCTYFLLGRKIKVIDEKCESQIVKAIYKNPPVPEGFSKVETENASWEIDENGYIKGWNNGLVVEDKNGNQFVWVPCSTETSDEVTLYSRYYTVDGKDVIPVQEENIKHLNISKTGETTYYYEDNEINDEIEEMVVKYGGFYIGRYEIGIEEINNQNQICVKENCSVLSNLTAEDILEESKTIINTENAKTYLMTSYCFDTTIKWLELSNNEFRENPYKFCNFLNDGKTLNYTGASENYKINNIYDIIGNAGEFTTEKYYNEGNIFNVYRGPAFYQEINQDSRIYLNFIYGGRGYLNIGSGILGGRVVLILK